jgi:NAD(P)-dependent dehydrogenase (short-subunit alcohol dehydrogenase family)
MATPMVAALRGDPSAIEETKRGLAASSPLKGRAGVADDVVNAALWLASDESGYTSGHTLTTDAGLTVGSGNTTPFEEYQPIIREAGKRGMDD